MATFQEHIAQSKRNLDYLSRINFTVNERWDWQVTVCFYSALHLMNAHIADKNSMNYLSHKRVDAALNPYSLSPGRLDENTYLAYNRLVGLSKRARYLINDKDNNVGKGTNDINDGFFTHSVHFKKAIANLDVVITYMSLNYSDLFGKTDIKCADITNIKYNHFNIVK